MAARCVTMAAESGNFWPRVRFGAASREAAGGARMTLERAHRRRAAALDPAPEGTVAPRRRGPLGTRSSRRRCWARTSGASGRSRCRACSAWPRSTQVPADQLLPARRRKSTSTSPSVTQPVRRGLHARPQRLNATRRRRRRGAVALRRDDPAPAPGLQRPASSRSVATTCACVAAVLGRRPEDLSCRLEQLGLRAISASA